MSGHCEGCVMCEADGVPVAEAAWLNWPWLRKAAVVRERTDPLRNQGPRARRRTDPKAPGPGVIVMGNGRRHRIRRGNPPVRPAIENGERRHGRDRLPAHGRQRPQEHAWPHARREGHAPMRPLLHRLIAWLLAALDDSRCPYDCPRHRDSWMRRVPPRGW